MDNAYSLLSSVDQFNPRKYSAMHYSLAVLEAKSGSGKWANAKADWVTSVVRVTLAER